MNTFGKSSHLKSTIPSISLPEFAVGKELEVAPLYDEVSIKNGRNQLRDTTVVVYKAYKLTRPKLDRLFRHAFRVMDSKRYHFAVLFDNTLDLAESTVVVRDPRYQLLDHKRFHMFNYTLYDVLGEFPQLAYYLYQATFVDDQEEENDGKVRGSCCERNDMWQLLRAPIILWQNVKDLRFQYTWMIEDDFEALKGGESVLMELLMDLDKQYPHVDVMAFRHTPCPTTWHKIRQTPKFKQIVARNEKKKFPWLCLADYAQRLSQAYLRTHEKALHSFVFAFGETMVYPVALDAGLVVKLYSTFDMQEITKRPFEEYYNKSVADPNKIHFAHIKD